METNQVCYTRDVALEKAIELERRSFETYKEAFKKVQNQEVRELIKEFALDELEHKYTLEKAFFEEVVALHDGTLPSAPSMNFSQVFSEEPLGEDATYQDVLLFAIHDEKHAVDFYGQMASQCVGAPMESMFRKLAEDEEKHLARLEELYEEHCLPEM